MKTILKLTLTLTFVFFACQTLLAQTTLDQAMQSKVAEKTIAGAELGSLVCQDANGKKIVCTGAIEESILGIVTNAPYITVNKPATPDANKSIFTAKVSASAGAISKGDFLTAGANGTLIRCTDNNFAYAVALDAADGIGMIRVKVLSK